MAGNLGNNINTINDQLNSLSINSNDGSISMNQPNLNNVATDLNLLAHQNSKYLENYLMMNSYGVNYDQLFLQQNVAYLAAQQLSGKNNMTTTMTSPQF